MFIRLLCSYIIILLLIIAKNIVFHCYCFIYPITHRRLIGSFVYLISNIIICSLICLMHIILFIIITQAIIITILIIPIILLDLIKYIHILILILIFIIFLFLSWHHLVYANSIYIQRSFFLNNPVYYVYGVLSKRHLRPFISVYPLARYH